MAKEQEEDIVDKLRERGLSCSKLQSLEKREIKEAGEFRKIGFTQIASAQEISASKIKNLRQKICKLK